MILELQMRESIFRLCIFRSTDPVHRTFYSFLINELKNALVDRGLSTFLFSIFFLSSSLFSSHRLNYFK